MKKVLFLTGFMGAGKSSVVRGLAKRLGWREVDLDRLIEERTGRSISQIFEQSGEEAFRDIETAALRDAMELDGVVVATGGGVILREENRRLLNSVTSVNLTADFDTLYGRISHTGSKRPLVRAGEDKLRELFEARKPLYDEMPLQVDTRGKKSWEVVEEVLGLLSGLGIDR